MLSIPPSNPPKKRRSARNSRPAERTRDELLGDIVARPNGTAATTQGRSNEPAPWKRVSEETENRGWGCRKSRSGHSRALEKQDDLGQRESSADRVQPYTKCSLR